MGTQRGETEHGTSSEGAAQHAQRASVPLDDPEYAARLRRKLQGLAWHWYRIPAERSEDVLQTAIATFLAVRHRYRKEVEHPAILVGIFRKKCLEYIDRSMREHRKLDRYCHSADAARESVWIRPRRPAQSPSVLEELVAREESAAIVDAIAHLRPASQELVSKMIDDGMSRGELITYLGLNKNTVDSRLHVLRRELRGLLDARMGDR